MLALVYCWNDLDIVSFVSAGHCNHRKPYDCKISPDHYDDFALPCHYVEVCEDGFFYEQCQAVCTEYQEDLFGQFFSNE